MDAFLQEWNKAALTTLGYFWRALWAFVLGYIVSGCIQVFVTRERMQRTMGQAGGRSMALATFFGFISSSCSFAALAGAKSLFKKGAGLIPALAFLLSSTNLVIELGIVISIFLGWQFVVGEYAGGILLICFTWLFVKLLYPKRLVEDARERLRDEEDDGDDGEVPDWKDRVRSLEGWRMVAEKYFMEWNMVWKDVTVGFTVAGVIASFVPAAFFQGLFLGSNGDEGFLTTVAHSLIGPVAAFFTFIGSMGNIPLAALLFGSGVSFAGVMAFIFSDLVVFPVIRMNAKFYGWKMAAYIAGIFLMAIVGSAVAMHWAFAAFDLLPQAPTGEAAIGGGDAFQIDLTFWMNLVFLGLTAVLAWLKWGGREEGHGHVHHGDDADWIERTLTVLAIAAYAWLTGGMIVGLVI